MSAILYTSTNKIRSSLGLTAQDVSDEQLLARDLDKELSIDLASWLPTHAVLYSAGTAVDATAQEQIIADALVLYSMYFCALLELHALRLAAPQQVSDGKNSLGRFTPMDWQRLETTLASRAEFYKGQLQELVAQITPTTAVKLFEGVGLLIDPATTVQ